jgi:predicted nucleic acid-binding Zn ribbon protein
MFEQFSSGYYLGRLYVEPHSGNRAVMHSEQHEHVNEQLYDGHSGPLVMKIGSTHVPVHGADGVPGQTVALPESVLPAAGVQNPPALREVLLAKADRATQLLGVGVGTETSDDAQPEPDDSGPAGF